MEKFKFDNGEHEFTGIESESGKSLIFSDEFKEIVQKHPRLIGKIHKTIKEGFYKPRNLLKDDEEVEFDFDAASDLSTSRFCIKLVLKDTGEEYFIKSDNSEENPFREILVMEYVKEALKDLPWVKFADYQCGYFDKNGWGFYVAKWNDVLKRNAFGVHDRLINDYKIDHSDTLQDIDFKIKTVTQILVPRGILVDHNISYDIDTGDLYLYDLRMKDGDFNALMDRKREDFKLQK